MGVWGDKPHAFLWVGVPYAVLASRMQTKAEKPKAKAEAVRGSATLGLALGLPSGTPARPLGSLLLT